MVQLDLFDNGGSADDVTFTYRIVREGARLRFVVTGQVPGVGTISTRAYYLADAIDQFRGRVWQAQKVAPSTMF